MFNINGKVVALTGGGGVLCGTMARALAEAGARVAILDLSEDSASQVASQCTTQYGAAAFCCKVDVLDRESLEQAARAVLGCFGRIDILINGAGGNRKNATTGPDQSFFDIPAEALQWVFNLNVIGTILPCQVFGKIMAKQGEGIIINISSMNAFRPLTRIPGYSAAKAAVSNFTQWLAVHMAQDYSTRIRVNAIAPGFFLTEQNRFLLTESGTGELTARGRQIIDHTPMGQFGRPEDLVGPVLWLCSDASRFVHGTVIPVDGGFSAYAGV